MTIRYSEIFYSLQGEGLHTGIPTVWIRLFSCNLQCNGFGQKDPTDPDTYVLPWKDIPLDDIQQVEDIPIFERGCDSGFSWASRFKHLQHNDTADEIVQKLREAAGGQIRSHNKSGQPIHLCFTGGEPLLPQNQKAICEIIRELQHQKDAPTSITIETNGTQPLSRELSDVLYDFAFLSYNVTNEIVFSVSPKLFTVSGEKPDKAINIPNIKELHNFMYGFRNKKIYLKFVVNGSYAAWDQIEEIRVDLKLQGVKSPSIWIMPVGGTIEGQKGLIEDHTAGKMDDGSIVDEALRRGYNVSARLQNYLWNNATGK